MKSDKELAVKFASAYITSWFSRESTVMPLKEDMIQSLITASYNAIHSLPDE